MAHPRGADKGAPIYWKDAGHQIYRYAGTWHIAHEGVVVFYDPPASSYWATEPPLSGWRQFPNRTATPPMPTLSWIEQAGGAPHRQAVFKTDDRAPAGTDSSARVVDIPWEYKGFETFPAAWFGASPTGAAARGMMPESNVTMEIMARHQLVGWV